MPVTRSKTTPKRKPSAPTTPTSLISSATPKARTSRTSLRAANLLKSDSENEESSSSSNESSDEEVQPRASTRTRRSGRQVRQPVQPKPKPAPIVTTPRRPKVIITPRRNLGVADKKSPRLGYGMTNSRPNEARQNSRNNPDSSDKQESKCASTNESSQVSPTDSGIDSLSRDQIGSDIATAGPTTTSSASSSSPTTADSTDQVKSEVPKPEVNVTPVAQEKPRVPTNDQIVRHLYRSTSSNCRKAETAALDFLVEEVHHPAISCFRELMNFNDLATIFRSNGKKRQGSFEFGLTCLGMLDSIAMTLHNPLYQESFDCLWNRKVSQKVEKILQKMKPLLTTWGTSEKPADQERYASMTKYLERLVPRFEPIHYADTFQAGITRITENVTHLMTMRQELRLKTQSFFNSKDTPTPATPGPSTSSASPTSEVETVSSISPVTSEISSKKDEDSVSVATTSPPESSVRSVITVSDETETENDWKKSSFSSSWSESPSPQKKTKIKILKSSTSVNATDDDDVRVVGVNLTKRMAENDDNQEEPTAKKARIEPESPSTSSALPKPTVNAFALMMNRSRQLAVMAKQTTKGHSPQGLLNKSKSKVITVTAR